MNKYIIVGSIIFIGVIANLVVLYRMVFEMQNTIRLLHDKQTDFSQLEKNADLPREAMFPLASPSANIDICEGCRNDINKLKDIIARLTPSVGTSLLSVPVKNSEVKEVVIPLGSGKTSKTDWEDIPGMNAMINSANYSQINSVTFEVSLRIPTANGTVEARLFNKTDKHPVWYSDVSSEGPVSTIKQSKNITLDIGDKLYQVQMKNTMQTESIADSARLKIVLQ